MIRFLRHPALLLGLLPPVVAGSVIAGTHVAAAAGSHHRVAASHRCASGAVVREAMRAPRSVANDTPFTVVVIVRNCTAAAQQVTLEGRQRAPGSCSAPVIDPLSVTIQPHQRFGLRERVPAESCPGRFTVTWSVVQHNIVIAHRTRHVRIRKV